MRVEDLSILIVDDDPKDLVGLERSLLPLGARVATLEDPNKVLSEVESQRPDLVVLDALLPGVSGFDLCKKIKTESQAQDTLVIIITGVYLKEQYRRDALHSFKADGFLTKPCRPVELQRVVLGLMAKQHKTTPSLLAGKVTPPVGDPEPEEVVTEAGWLGRLWGKLKGERSPGLTSVISLDEGLEETSESEASKKAEPEPAPTQASKPDELAAPAESVDTVQDEKPTSEGIENDQQEDADKEEEEETTLRLLPTDSKLEDLPSEVSPDGEQASADGVESADVADPVDGFTEIREVEPENPVEKVDAEKPVPAARETANPDFDPGHGFGSDRGTRRHRLSSTSSLARRRAGFGESPGRRCGGGAVLPGARGAHRFRIRPLRGTAYRFPRQACGHTSPVQGRRGASRHRSRPSFRYRRFS